MGLRIGAFKTCQVQNAQIDRRQRDIGGVARSHTVHLQAHGQRAARLHPLGHVDADAQRLVARVHLRITDPQGAGRVPTGIHIHRPDDRRADIGPCPPLLGHRQFNQVFALGHRHGLQADQAIGHDRDNSHPSIARHDAERSGIAQRILRRIERGFQQVRRIVERGGRIPARTETGRGDSMVLARRLHNDFMLAPAHRAFYRDRPRREIGSAAGDAGAGRDRFPPPAVVQRIPLIPGRHLVHRPFHLHVGGGQIRGQRDQVKLRLGAFGDNALKERLDPDHRLVRAERHRHLPLDRAARAFLDPGYRDHFQRL